MVKKTMPPLPRDKFHAFFSSHYGGIITETPYMVIPIEDRLFTKGHGAFDMCLMVNGYLYNLEAHIDRFMQSLAKAGLELPYGRRDLAKTILHTAAASTKLNGGQIYRVRIVCTLVMVSPHQPEFADSCFHALHEQLRDDEA